MNFFQGLFWVFSIGTLTLTSKFQLFLKTGNSNFVELVQIGGKYKKEGKTFE